MMAFLMTDGLKRDLYHYCIKAKGKWWSNFLFTNDEVGDLYRYLRRQDKGTVVAILGCGCLDYNRHIFEWTEIKYIQKRDFIQIVHDNMSLEFYIGK